MVSLVDLVSFLLGAYAKSVLSVRDSTDQESPWSQGKTETGREQLEKEVTAGW